LYKLQFFTFIIINNALHY